MPINLPVGFAVRSSTFSLLSNTRTYTSPFSQSTQRSEMAGARWKASFEFPPLTRAEAAPILAFLAQLRGAANTFYGFDPAATQPQGSAGGTPLVNGSGQTGRSLVTDGWPANQAVLKAGDYFQINNELKMMTADAISNSLGAATLLFEPALRSSPANNAALITNNPTCVMRLVDDEQASWDVDESLFYRIRFSAIEAF